MQELFLELVKLSLTGSLFVLAVMLVRILFRKAPKWLFCLLWGVVALRLICPISIESDLSLVPDRLANGQIISNVGSDYIGEVNIIYENNAGYSNAVNAGRQPIYSDSGYYVVTEKDSYDAPATVEETVFPVLSWIWFVGMVLMLAYTIISYALLKRKMEEATLLRDNIWQCEQADSPFVLGIIKPRIYLPYQISDSDMDNVIAHELAHIHRKDHWWKPIGFLLLSVHWFNPVMWIAYILLCRDIEAACDEKVIKHMEKDEMRAYSTALLHCSVHRRRIAACPLAFGEVGVKERIKRVMNYKKPTFWIIILAIVASILAGVFLLTDPIRTVDGIQFTFEAEDVENIEMYHFEGITTSAEKKVLTSKENIQYIYEMFSSLSLQVKDIDDTLSASVTSFRFNLSDGSCYELIYRGYGVKKGELESPTDVWVYFTSADIGWCWTMLNSELEAVPAKESELPGFIPITNLDIITPVEDKPQMSFAGLEVNDTLVDKEFVVVLESGASLDYNISYASQAIKLEFGLLALNGAEVSHYIEHGSSQGTLENIPAGLYHLFVRNVGYVNDLPGEAVEGGAVVCEIRNADEIISANLSVLNATVLEIGNGRILVEPLDGSWELNSASKIEIPMKNMDPALEPQVGDVIEITYNGEIQETYPARIDEVFGIRVISERPYITEALTLNEVADLVKQQHTVSFVGMTREAVHGYWGEPDAEVHGFFGDIYHVPDSYECIIFRYNEDEIVESVIVEERNNVQSLDEIPGGTRFIVEIRDRAEEEQLACAEAEELFYEDETTEYYFSVIKSHYVIVTYNNGNSEDIVTALNAGRATIADLDKFGIEYHTQPKE